MEVGGWGKGGRTRQKEKPEKEKGGKEERNRTGRKGEVGALFFYPLRVTPQQPTTTTHSPGQGRRQYQAPMRCSEDGDDDGVPSHPRRGQRREKRIPKAHDEDRGGGQAHQEEALQGQQR